MTLEQSILDAIRTLPPEKKAELLSFVEKLKGDESNTPRESGYGLISHLNVRISAEEIDQARREIWGGFPRDDI
jgi:hypothetical protein